ncbi:PEP/pyruvate-binding domain-containing protein [Anaerolineales bacterium HSG24]|nr:PEP/pyruvate-binding domain-containing protein [Anaerolineales bacterium HSG24]
MENQLTVEPWIYNLDEIRGNDLPLVGGKAYRLALLRQNSLQVPPGLVLTTHFFENQLKRSHLTTLWAGSPDVQVTTDALSWLSDTLKTKPIDRELTHTLNQQLNQNFGPEIQSFAVRSSAIDEDQRDHTFAGVHLTELGVPRVMLPVAITRCWASALSETAAEYRIKHGMSIQGIQIAVLIQPMLTPQSSGVGFTINPLTGSTDEMIVEATWGLGESLVSGKIQPYSYKLANDPPRYPVLEHQTGNVPPPDDEADMPLSPTELTALVNQLEQIQAIMGEAQDVEWAKQDGSFFLLQTRPVTPPANTGPMLDQAWTRGSHVEFLPDLPSPLFASLLERTERQAQQFFEAAQIDVTPYTPYLKIHLGRPYLNLSLIKKGMNQLGLNVNGVLRILGYQDRPTQQRRLSVDWQILRRKRHIYKALWGQIRQAETSVQEYQKLVEEMVVDLNGVGTDRSTSELQTQLRQHDRIYNGFFKAELPISMGIAALTAISSTLIAPLTHTPGTVVKTLASQGIDKGANQLNQSLLTLAQNARKDQSVCHYFKHASVSFNDYDTRLAGTLFLKQFHQLLTEQSYRATYEADLGWPRYLEAPEVLLRIIQHYVLSEHQTNTSVAPILLWSDLVKPATGLQRLHSWRRWAVQPFIKQLHNLLILRHRLNEIRAKGMTACRQWDKQLAEQWVKQGWLTEVDDIFWLKLEEIERVILAGVGAGLTISATIQARKETYQGYAQLTPPFNLQESELPAIQYGLSTGDRGNLDVLTGLPVSPGQACGTVMVVNSPEEFEPIADEVILVTSSTNPDWLSLLNRSAGLIVEVGGLLSHGSVIAREYGLPGVANVPQATKRFQTGDVVLVDGSTGVIQVLERTKKT